MNVSDHLKEFHLVAGRHHTDCAKAHRAMASAHEGLIDKSAAHDYHKDLASAHNAAAESHLRSAEFHIQTCQKLEAATDSMPHVERESRTNAYGEGLANVDTLDDLRKQLEPPPVRGVLPEVPPRLVPRIGQPDTDEHEDATAVIDRVCG